MHSTKIFIGEKLGIFMQRVIEYGNTAENQVHIEPVKIDEDSMLVKVDLRKSSQLIRTGAHPSKNNAKKSQKIQCICS